MMPLKRTLLAAAALAAAVLCMPATARAQTQDAPEITMPYREFLKGEKVYIAEREDLEGRPVRIDAAVGKKIVVMAFWLNTCDVCIEQMKELRDVIREHKLQDQVAVFTVVRVSDDFERDDVADMYRDSGLDWPVIVDPHVMLAKQFAITIVPAFHIIAKDRTLLTRQVHTIRKPLRNLTFEDMLLRAVKGEPIAAIEFEKPSTTEAQRALLDKPAPDFSLEDVFGNPYTLSGSTDQTPLLIIFWHPECPTCVKAMPVLQDHLRTLMKRYDFNILSVAVLKGESQARDAVDYIERYDLPFPVLADSDAAVGKSYRVNSIPSLYFIDSQGTVRDIISDISDELDRIIDPVIAEIAAPLPGKDK